MPATLDNAFLFILQGTVLADLRYGGRINGSCFFTVNFCLLQ